MIDGGVGNFKATWLGKEQTTIKKKCKGCGVLLNQISIKKNIEYCYICQRKQECKRLDKY